MSLANHGGGWLQFGFVEGSDGQFVHQIDERCPDATKYSTDGINGLIRRFAQPAFQCEVFCQACDQCAGGHALPWCACRAAIESRWCAGAAGPSRVRTLVKGRCMGDCRVREAMS